METLPNELLGETAENLTNRQLLSFCSGVNKRIQELCKKKLIPDRMRRYFAQGIVLPYEEPDPFKQLLIYESIAGSDLVAASLVHPDYALFQAIKFNNPEVIAKYEKYRSTAFTSRYNELVTKTRNYNYIKKITKSQVPYMFDQEIRDPADFEAFVEKAIKLGTIEKLDYLSPIMIKNILRYGTVLFSDDIMEKLAPFAQKLLTEQELGELGIISDWRTDRVRYQTLLKFYDDSNPSEFLLKNELIGQGEEFDKIPAKLFERYVSDETNEVYLEGVVKAIWAWNRWDLWYILIKYKDVSAIEKPEQLLEMNSDLGHLSVYSLTILYSLFPSIFSIKNTTKYSETGYLPLILFSNSRNLPVLHGTVDSNVNNQALNNSYLYQSINKAKISYNNVEFSSNYWNNIIDSQFTGRLGLPPNYYMLSNTYGKVVQLAVWTPGAPNFEKFYLENPLPNDDALMRWIKGVMGASFIDQDILEENKPAIEEYVKLNYIDSASEKDKLKRLIQKMGPVFASGEPSTIVNALGMSVWDKNPIQEFLYLIKYTEPKLLLDTFDQEGYAATIAKLFKFDKKDSELFRPVFAKMLLDRPNPKYSVMDYRLFLKLYPKSIPDSDAEIILNTFVKSFSAKSSLIYDGKTKWDSLFKIFSPKMLARLVPMMLSYYMYKSINPLGYFRDFLKKSKKIVLNSTDAAFYYNIACPYGLSFLNGVCTPSSIKSTLAKIARSNAPGTFRDYAKSFL